jgi:hypothetical protein
MLAVLLAGCGGVAAKPKPAVRVSGDLIALDYTNSIGADEGTDPCLFTRVSIGGTQLTFRDGRGNIIGTTTTGGAQKIPHEGGQPDAPLPSCEIRAGYSISVPRASFYQIDVEGYGRQEPIPYSKLSDGRWNVVVSVGT